MLTSVGSLLCVEDQDQDRTGHLFFAGDWFKAGEKGKTVETEKRKTTEKTTRKTTMKTTMKPTEASTTECPGCTTKCPTKDLPKLLNATGTSYTNYFV